jgi:hypothetical protein
MNTYILPIGKVEELSLPPNGYIKLQDILNIKSFYVQHRVGNEFDKVPDYFNNNINIYSLSLTSNITNLDAVLYLGERYTLHGVFSVYFSKRGRDFSEIIIGH